MQCIVKILRVNKQHCCNDKFQWHSVDDYDDDGGDDDDDDDAIIDGDDDDYDDGVIGGNGVCCVNGGWQQDSAQMERHHHMTRSRCAPTLADWLLSKMVLIDQVTAARVTSACQASIGISKSINQHWHALAIKADVMLMVMVFNLTV